MANKSLSEIGKDLIEEEDSTPSGTITGVWKKPTLFVNKKKTKNDVFDVEMEFSSQESESHLSQASSISSQKSGKTLSQDTSHDSKNLQLFKHQRRLVKDAFDVDFEDSKQISSQENTSEVNITEIKRTNPFQNKKKSKYNAFDIDFEESKQVLTPEDTNDENLSRMKKPNPFKSKKQTKYNAFDVDFEESKQVLTPEDTNDENLSRIKKPNPFKSKKQSKYNAFDVDFEESKQVLTSEDTNEGNLSKIRKQNPFGNKKQTKYNTFEIDFEESGEPSTPEDTGEMNLTKIRKPNPFQNKKQSTYNAFEIDFDESKQMSTPEDTNDGNLSKVRDQNPFKNKKQTGFNAFEIDFEESTTGPITPATPDSNKITPFRSSGKSLTENAFDVNFDKSTDTNVIRSITATARENSFKGKSIDVSDSIPIPRDKSFEESHSRLDVSSFNDDNLNGWMSDHSGDEIKRGESLEESTGRKSLPISPPMKTSELNSTSDQDLEKRFRLKLSAIIDGACKGKTEKSPLVPRKNNNTDPSKKRSDDKERKPSWRKNKLAKPAPYVNKRLYNYLVKKMEPEHGIDSVLRAEEIVKSICDVVKIVSRRKNYQKKLVHDLKVEMAKRGIIETTNDFYVFVRSFLPYDFREKVIPCLQPGTNIVFPPKDSKSPFEKILNN